MSARVPASARRILDAGVLCYLGVPTSNGPHLTPLVYVLDGGRIWITTSRSSVKARVWRRRRDVAGLVEGADLSLMFRGHVKVYDALDPLSWPAAAVAWPWVARAATRFSLKNARFFAGYAVDARRVPLAWTPPGRVFARVELVAGRVLDQRTGRVEDGWGAWPSDVRFAPRFEPLPSARGIDLGVPGAIRRTVGSRGTGALAIDGSEMTVVPVTWKRVAREGVYEAASFSSFLGLASMAPAQRAALTIGYASTWRAAEMTGMLLQGGVDVFSVATARRGKEALRREIRGLTTKPMSEDEFGLVRVHPERVVWWRGWSAGTVGRRSLARSG